MSSVHVNGVDGGIVIVDYDTDGYAMLAESLLGDATADLVDSDGFTIPSGVIDTAFGTASGEGLGSVTGFDDSQAGNQLILVGNGTDLNLYASAGGGTIIAGDGNDVFTLNNNIDAAWNVYLGAGTADVTINGHSGHGVVVMGGVDTVVAEGSNPYAADGANPSLVFGSPVDGCQVESASDNGFAFLTYVGGAGACTVTASSGTVLGFGGTGTTTYDLAPREVVEPPAALVVIVGGADITNVANLAGVVEFFGSAGSVLNVDGVPGGNVFVAGAGNETLNGTNTFNCNAYFGGSGADMISAGIGNDVLFAGSGNNTLAGGLGNDVFAFVDQIGGTTGHDTITDFTVGSDTLELIDGVTIADQATASGQLVVTLSDHTQITFAGLTTDLGTSSIYNA